MCAPGVATNSTALPSAKLALHLPGQAIPAGLDVMLPFPVMLTASVCRTSTAGGVFAGFDVPESDVPGFAPPQATSAGSNKATAAGRPRKMSRAAPAIPTG